MATCSQCTKPAMYFQGELGLCLGCMERAQEIWRQQMNANIIGMNQALDDMESVIGFSVSSARRPLIPARPAPSTVNVQ